MQSNQKTKRIPKIKVTKTKIPEMNLFVDQSNYKVLKGSKYILETETEIATKSKSVMGIKTPLNTMSITLQDKRERN